MAWNGTLSAFRRASTYLPCHTRKIASFPGLHTAFAAWGEPGNEATRKMLYQTFVLPHLDYCAVVWRSCEATLDKNIERIQNYAMRLILHQPPLTRSESLRFTLGWSTLRRGRLNAMLYQVHRCINNYAPSYLVPKFFMNSTLAGYPSTCGVHKLHLNDPFLTFTEWGPRFLTPCRTQFIR